MTYIREIYGTNFYWQHVRSLPANDRMQMVYRFRCGLSRLVPFPLREPIQPVSLR